MLRAINTHANDKIIVPGKNSHHASFGKGTVGLKVVADLAIVGAVFFLYNATTLSKYSMPSRVGSPPCQEKIISGVFCPSMYCHYRALIALHPSHIEILWGIQAAAVSLSNNSKYNWCTDRTNRFCQRPGSLLCALPLNCGTNSGLIVIMSSWRIPRCKRYCISQQFVFLYGVHRPTKLDNWVGRVYFLYFTFSNGFHASSTLAQCFDFSYSWYSSNHLGTSLAFGFLSHAAQRILFLCGYRCPFTVHAHACRDSDDLVIPLWAKKFRYQTIQMESHYRHCEPLWFRPQK